MNLVSAWLKKRSHQKMVCERRIIQPATDKGHLNDQLVYLCTNANARRYPTEFQTWDAAWEELRLSLENLRRILGEERFEQLSEMSKIARTHYEADETHLASWLMQDMEQVVKGRAPFAYPEEQYGWPRAAGVFGRGVSH